MADNVIISFLTLSQSISRSPHPKRVHDTLMKELAAGISIDAVVTEIMNAPGKTDNVTETAVRFWAQLYGALDRIPVPLHPRAPAAGFLIYTESVNFRMRFCP